MDIVEKARVFAIAAHTAKSQIRKYTNEPYWLHPQEVAQQVAALLDHTPEMVAAAWLHDVVEDTGVTIETVREEFGSKVADLVGWLTDVSRPDHGNRAARKAVDRAHTALAPSEAQTIKCMDIASNFRSLVEHDAKFAATYLVEKRALLEVLTRADPVAIQFVQDVLDDAEQDLQRQIVVDSPR
jgi:(p)ppGpp synthase/HD superfamily hydrolase